MAFQTATSHMVHTPFSLQVPTQKACITIDLQIQYKGSRSPPDALLPPFSPSKSFNPPENA